MSASSGIITRALSRLLPERALTWREGRKLGWACMAYGGRFGDGETRVCGNLRGHLDSHAYDRINVVLAPRGFCERDGVLVQLARSLVSSPEPGPDA